MISTATSTANPRIQALRALSRGKGREASGCFLVEGTKLCAEALRDARVQTLLVDMEKQEDFAALMAQAENVLLAPAHVVASVCETRTPQGIAAAVYLPPALDLKAAAGPLLALDGVQDPGNVGAMLRTAEAAGVGGLLLSEACADAFAPKTVRGSMGSVLRLPVWRGELTSALARLKGKGYIVIASALGGAPWRPLSLPGGAPYALVIGSEGSGISGAVLALSDHRLALPMRGRAESLNAAVAAGILMYGLQDMLCS